jgi:hypothetical protein
MPVYIPFQPSRNNYRLVVPLNSVPFIFDVRWNSRDNAWYFDLREEDETAIRCGNKILVGSKIGRASNHGFFVQRSFDVVDTSGSGTDAGYDDLGARVQVILTDRSEVILPT